MKHRFKKLLATLLAASLCVPALPAAPAHAAEPEADAAIVWTDPETVPVTALSETERVINFNEEWKFYFGDSSTAHNVNFMDSSWEDISLPHDFSIMQDFTAAGEAESGFLLGGTGWYRKQFALPENFEGKNIILNFDGVYKDTEVYVNGTKLGEHHYGYSPFAFNITDHLVYDGMTKNVIAVKAVNNVPSSRWYSGSGIYRDVSLIVTGPVHVDLNGTYVTTPNIASSNGSDGAASISADIKNDSGSSASVTVKNTIYEKGSETAVATASDVTATVAAGATETVTATASVSNPKLWSIDAPNLYTVRTEIVQDGETVDTYETEFGYKWYEFVDNTGFKLNGENVKINGVCMHHDQGALGAAAYYDAIYRQMSIMKDMGVNTIRITHNPGSESLVDICNEMGLLVIEEFFDGWMAPKNGNSNDLSKHFNVSLTNDNQVIDGDPSMTWAEFTLKSIVKRDRNDASLILWSLCNEVSEGTARSDDADWKTTAQQLIGWTQEMDTAHPVTSGSNRRSLCASDTSTEVTAVNHAVYQAGGVPGYNYGNLAELTSLHQRYPVMLWSETASAVNSRGIYTTQASQGFDRNYHLTSYDKSCVGWGKTAHASMYPTLRNDWIAGECVWTGFDYIGEPTPLNGTGTGDGGRGAIPNSSYFGIVETSGFPKDNYYLYRSQWNHDSSTLHLVTAWDPDNMMETDSKTPVWVYSNAPKVELFLNGQKIGTATRKALSGTTSAAGHVHYEYTTQSNSNVCATTSGTGDESLYSVFNVAFTEGTISAKAYDENGAEITDSCAGTHSVSTPGAPAKLVIPDDYAKSIDADGKSLSYITVDVKDENGNLKTTAANEIRFSLTGNGEIVGVDNGDQATVHKYQQKSVLTSASSAKIRAYAGKALVIVRSTKDAGGFTLTAESDSLTSATATVQTTKTEDSSSVSIDHFTMSKHLYLPIGSAADKVSLPASVTAGMTDGTQKSLNVTWNDYDEAVLNQKGSHEVFGTVTENGKQTFVSVLLHVYKDIVGIQNHAFITGLRSVPSLPTVSMAYDSDGDAFEEYPVTWNTSNLSESSFETAGEIVTVTGTASIFGKSYTATASIRVAEPETVYTNVAPMRDHLTDNGLEYGSTTRNGRRDYDDNLETLTDRNRRDNSGSEHWSDYGYRTDSAPKDNLQIAMDWATATSVDHVDIYFSKTGEAANAINNARDSVTVKIESAAASNYSSTTEMLESAAWTNVPYTASDIASGDDAIICVRHSFSKTINPQALRFTLGHAGSRFIALSEIEVMNPSSITYTANDEASLTSASAGSETITFNSSDNTYTTTADTLEASSMTVVNPHHSAVTVLQLNDAQVKILSTSEDGSETKTYMIIGGSITKIKSQLKEKAAEYRKLVSWHYTPESYQALKALLDELTDAAIDSLPDNECRPKLVALTSAYTDLVSDTPATATKKALQKKIDEYKALNGKFYENESFNAFQEKVAEAESKINEQSNSQLVAKQAELETEFQNLERSPDYPTEETKAALLAKLTEYGQLGSEPYTESSYEAFMNLMDEIRTSVSTLLESELQQKMSDLETAFENLIPTKASVQEKLDEYKEIDPSLYTPESYQAFKGLMDEMEAGLESFSDEERRDKFKALTAAYSTLVPDAATEESKTALQEKVNQYKELAEKFYEASSFRTLQDLIADIEEHINQYSESQLVAKLAELNTAFENLEKVADYPTSETKTALEEKLEEYAGLDGSAYTEESYQALAGLVEEITGSVDTLLESELKEKLAALADAYEALVPNPQQVQKILDEYKNIDPSLYTPESYEALQALVSELETKLDTLTPAELKEELKKLSEARNDLVSDEATTETKESMQEKLEACKGIASASYTKASYDKMKALMDEIEENIDKWPETTLKAKLAELEEAQKALVTIAKDNLLKQASIYRSLNSSAYTATSYGKLKTLLDDVAKNSGSWSDAQCNTKLSALKAAYNNLATVRTYNALRAKLKTYAGLNKADYTAASYNALASLIAQINSRINSYTEAQLKTQTAALDAKYRALQKAAPAAVTSVNFKDVTYKVLDAKKKTAAASKIAKKSAKKITIQATVKIGDVTYKVTEISANAFKGASKLNNVTIGKNVKKIGANAFKGCKKLATVTFKGSSAPKFSKGAFKQTSSKMKVKVPKKLKKASFKKKLTSAGMSKKMKWK